MTFWLRIYFLLQKVGSLINNVTNETTPEKEEKINITCSIFIQKLTVLECIAVESLEVGTYLKRNFKTLLRQNKILNFSNGENAVYQFLEQIITVMLY